MKGERIMSRIIRLGIFIVLIYSGSIQAAPVTWTVDSLLFDDGGTGSGTFSYDADTNTYSNINISTTAGSAFGGANYTSVVSFAPISANYLTVMVAPLEGLPGLELFFFTTGLTNNGGTFQIAIPSREALCGQECMFPASTLRYVASGQISAVPVPAAVWLFGSALAGLGWQRRKQTV